MCLVSSEVVVVVDGVLVTGCLSIDCFLSSCLVELVFCGQLPRGQLPCVRLPCAWLPCGLPYDQLACGGDPCKHIFGNSLQCEVFFGGGDKGGTINIEMHLGIHRIYYIKVGQGAHMSKSI